MDKTAFFITVILMSTLLVGGYFLFFPKGETTSNKPPQPEDQPEQKTKDFDPEAGKVETVPQLVNCTNKETEKASQQCLDKNFSECSPAFIRVTPSENVETKFKITGNENNGLCGVEIAFLQHPISSFSNKSMECMYDNSRSFKEEVMNSGLGSSNLDDVQKALQSCSGPLADQMRSLINLKL